MKKVVLFRKKKCVRKNFQVVLCNIMSSASEIPVMTFAVAVLDQQTTYNGLIHEGQQDQNPRVTIFGRHPKEGINEQKGVQLRAPRCSGWEHLSHEDGRTD